MQPTRRTFLQQAAIGALAVSRSGNLPPAGAATERDGSPINPCLIAIYLRGGADALSAVVPYGDPHYRRHRPALALAAPRGGDTDSCVLPLDDVFGFNPRMKEIHALYEAGLCAPIVDVGSPDPTRSHFDAQDFMERAAPGQKSVSTGWLNRYLHATRTSRDANLRAVSLQPLLPRALRGEYPVLAKPDQSADQALGVYASMYVNARSAKGTSGAKSANRAIQTFGARSIEQLDELTTVLRSEGPAAGKYPTTHFGQQMRDIAKLIKARRGLEIAGLDYGGWDHHIHEGPLRGQMAQQLGDLSAGIGAFAEDLGRELLEHVVVLVMSEFGRTVRENNNQGTDHGHGGFMLVVGGRVQGKKVYGRWTGLADDQLYEGRDLPVHTDFRMVFAESLQEMFGFDGFARKTFPDYASADPPLHFLRGHRGQ